MDPVVITKALVAADATAVCLSQGLAASGNLLINGDDATAGVATLDTQRRIGITSGGNDSGITFTVYGTMGSGVAISETVTGTNAGVASPLQDFLTVTRVSASGAVATTVTVGTTAVGSTAWQVPNRHITPFELSVMVDLTSGAATGTIEVAIDEVLAPISIYSTGFNTAPPVPSPVAWPSLTNVVGAASGVINEPIAGWRLTVTAGSGTLKATGIQAGISNH